MNERTARCLLLSKVLVADGMMTENERSFLDRAMTKWELSDDEKRKVVDLEGWDAAEQFLTALDEEKKQELVSELLDAASADGRLSPLESGMVKKITAAIGLKG
ncbi:MAG TPA: TerB family tellurite resistance protein [Polyangiaceae bacterium]